MERNQLRGFLPFLPSATPVSATPHCPILFSAVVKRRLSGLSTFQLTLLMLLLALLAVVQAQFTYTTNNGTITITG